MLIELESNADTFLIMHEGKLKTMLRADIALFILLEKTSLPRSIVTNVTIFVVWLAACCVWLGY
jgi:hypothetical protein